MNMGKNNLLVFFGGLLQIHSTWIQKSRFQSGTFTEAHDSGALGGLLWVKPQCQVERGTAGANCMALNAELAHHHSDQSSSTE